MSNVILSKADQLALQILEDLNKPTGDGIKAGLTTRLHSGQIEILKPLYQGGIKNHFFACGRKFGKTEIVGYVLWKHALENPGSCCFYIGPQAAHARKIIWDGARLQKFLGKETAKYIDSIRNQDMMIRLKNGSYIQVIGSDNYTVANGLTPDIAVYDEFKAFNPRWHTEFAPNRAAKAAPLVIIGTRPRAGNPNMDQYNDILSYMESDPRSSVFFKTTWDNPIMHLPEQKDITEQEIAQLRARGEEDVVQLEYYSNYVPGGKKAIFPMLDRVTHTQPHSMILDELKRDLRRMEWYCITDPGSTTCFGTLIACINPFSRKMYILDEIYETDQNMTSVRMMYPRMDAMMMKYYPNSDVNDDWIKGFDEAAVWFSNEVMQQYGSYFMPTMKHLNKKEHGLSLIKDLLIHDLVVISDRCENLLNEMEKYAKDDRGGIPKKDDHLIDCFRYLLGFANYNMTEVLEVIKQKNDDKRHRFRRMEDDSMITEVTDDWTVGVDKGMDEW